MTRALIVGGGIAGPVTAMALRRAGIDATVHEAYPRGADHVGAFLVLFANGLSALRAVDAERPVRERSFPADTVELLDDAGEPLGTHPIAGSRDPALRPRTLQRSDLYRALHDEAARRGIPVAYGKRLVGATTGPRGTVVASFADGSRAEGDLLIGADGIRSVTRALLDPHAPPPRHTGYASVCGSTRAPGHRVPPRTYRMIFGRRAFFGCTTAPDGTTHWFATIHRPEPSRPGRAIDPGRWRGLAVEALAGDGGPAAAVVASTGTAVVGMDTYDMPTTPVWHNSNTVLVGDAIHATAPHAAQGASIAIEDGVVLARCLRDLPDAGRAFAAYERLRRERVERVVAMSAGLAARARPTPE
ncbi:FAD-dependent monooxygenase, partial [Streptomyces sp. ISL-11]|uniref:FAD-dependent monooxygenase n=1 Tax=Streptomyces sp. ISL-11 TaxID=2819174 RepID=UPI001BE91369